MIVYPVGQRLVCIEDEWRHPRLGAMTLPRKGCIYTVRENKLSPWSNVPYGVRLFEIVNPPMQFNEAFAEACFDAQFFRPVTDKKTDIGFAHEILRKVSRSKETVA